MLCQDSILGTGSSARQVQTDLERGFVHREVVNWGTLGSVVIRVKPWVLPLELVLTQLLLPLRPIVPVAIGDVQKLQLSVSHHLLLCWIGF